MSVFSLLTTLISPLFFLPLPFLPPGGGESSWLVIPLPLHVERGRQDLRGSEQRTGGQCVHTAGGTYGEQLPPHSQPSRARRRGQVRVYESV